MNIRKRIILGLALVGAFLGVLDTSIVYTGTLKIASDLNLNASGLSWVQVSYALTYAGFMIIGGKLGDIYGRKTIFIYSLLIFGIGSIAVGASVTPIMIISSRAFQGIGAAILAPTCLALLTDNFEGKFRQRVIGYYASVVGAGAAIGLIIGGFFATFASWRVGFFINGPISLIMIIFAMSNLEKSEKHVAKLDIWGTILSILAMSSLAYGLDGSKNHYLVITISVILWIIFIIIEKRASNPTMPLEIFKDKERAGSYLSSLLFSASGVGFWFYTPQLLQSSLGYSAFITSIVLVPMAILLFIVAVQARRLIELFGNGKIMVMGFLFVLVSLIGLMLQAQSKNILLLILMTLLFGIGFALAFATMANSGLVRVKPEMTGSASGVYNTARQFGGALGLSLFSAFSHELTSIIDIFQNAMFIGSILTALGLLTVFMFILPTENKKFK
ncbi:MFS transporter [Leuconostoc citreum]|uniref:MFS transporter n=1 Tax=Leuconostoc citreum TaxID=33964 RepID=UPI0021A4B025|nr:MFS transporter [Leuconostoc citreum]MCT3073729.1 MFS transporter [Leuconostoc citreum]